jgi:tetratricopeptide (TPR) repeat protein
VERYLAGNLTGSAAALLALPADLRVLPILGETALPGVVGRIGEIAKANPGSAEASYYWGRAVGLPDSAGALRRAADLDKRDTRALLELGRQLANADRRAEAIGAYEEALGRDAGLATAHFRLSQLYRVVGNGEKSREHLRLYQQRR